MSVESVELGELCTLKNGKAYKESDWATDGHPIIRIQNLNNADKPFNYWPNGLDGQVEVHPGDVLLAWSGTPGTSFGAHLWQGRVGVLNQHIFRVDLDRTRISKRWAVLAINKQLDRLIDSAHGGVGLKHVTRGVVAGLEIPLPPLAEQKRIAAILDKADAVRRKRQRAIQLADEFLKSAFLEMFGDPVTNPKGWEVVKLEEIAAVNRGKFTPRPRNDPRFYGGVYPFIQTGELARTDGTLHSYSQTLNEEGIKVSRKFRKGTIAIAIAANIGDTAILGFDAYATDSVVGIEVNEENARKEFIEYWLRFQQDVLKAKAPETAQKNINLAVLRPLPTILPPMVLQSAFAEVYCRTEQSHDSHEMALKASTDLFNSLVQRAFRGEL
ncbi:restriction endonuclease subunit S [Aeoliella sp. ICT_H6.2]|uniref:Restriction endonuclease subunit S n=1 Tax=Aeoliella straminimaris TaxID=2954799 RepID=A0A9X2F939_9BACT|nr:restriction endonuclease subunit S [Aeoliella straminimaris]